MVLKLLLLTIQNETRHLHIILKVEELFLNIFSPSEEARASGD